MQFIRSLICVALAAFLLTACGGGGGSNPADSNPPESPPVSANSLVAFADPTQFGGWDAGASYEQDFGRFIIGVSGDEPMAIEELSYFVPPGTMFLGFNPMIDGDMLSMSWDYEGSSETGWNITIWPTPNFVVDTGDAISVSMMLIGVIPMDVPQYLDPAIYLSSVRATGIVSGEQYLVGVVKGPSGWIYAFDEKG